MSNKLIKQIGYWFYLLIGILGSSKQMYDYYNNQLELTLSQGILTALFGVLVFQPLILPKTFKEIVSAIIKIKTMIVSKSNKNSCVNNKNNKDASEDDL